MNVDVFLCLADMQNRQVCANMLAESTLCLSPNDQKDTNSALQSQLSLMLLQTHAAQCKCGVTDALRHLHYNHTI